MKPKAPKKSSVETTVKIDIVALEELLRAREAALKAMKERLDEAKTVRRQTLEREFSI